MALQVLMARRPRLESLFALMLGAFSVTGFAPLGWWPVPILCIAGLVWLWQQDISPRRAAWLGFIYGFGTFLVGVSWVYVSMHDVGKMPAWLAGAATGLLAAYLALYPALAGWLQARFQAHLQDRAPWHHTVLVIPAAWALSEWLRGWMLTGFPWLALGYSQVDSPLAGFAPLVGVYGMAFVLCVIAALLVRAVTIRAWASAAIALALGGAGWAAGHILWVKPFAAPFTVSLLQGNVPQELKFVPGRFEASITSYRRLLDASPARLIVLPETAIARLSDATGGGAGALLQADAISVNATVIAGAPVQPAAGTYFNAAFSLGRDAGQFYAKDHLVPFGEFIPLGAHWFVNAMQMPLADFTRGGAAQTPFQLSLGRERVAIALNICYEDLFGEEIVRQLPQAHVLLNLSNVAWFGDSLAPHQHLEISRMRALETGRPMLRATNTGATAVIDERGRVTARLAFFTEGALVANAQGMTGTTPFVALRGNAAVLLVSLMILVGAYWRMRQRQRPRQR